MIKFGSRHHLFEQSVQFYDEMTVGRAEKWIDQLQADLGGTEILSQGLNLSKILELSNKLLQTPLSVLSSKL